MFSAPSSPTAPALPAIVNQPAPPPMFMAQQSAPQGSKPKPTGQPTFLGAGLSANPSNTGQKTLLGQ